MGKDAFIATNFVLVPITSLSQGPRSLGPGPQGPGSQVLILDYAIDQLFFFPKENVCTSNSKKLRAVYMRPEVNSNRFEISTRFEKSFRLHGDLLSQRANDSF